MQWSTYHCILYTLFSLHQGLPYITILYSEYLEHNHTCYIDTVTLINMSRSMVCISKLRILPPLYFKNEYMYVTNEIIIWHDELKHEWVTRRKQ